MSVKFYDVCNLPSNNGSSNKKPLGIFYFQVHFTLLSPSPFGAVPRAQSILRNPQKYFNF